MHYKKLQRKNCKFPLELTLIPIAVAGDSGYILSYAGFSLLIRTDL